MKVKDLVRLLQAEDPTGETEVCVQNEDIFDVHTEPAYYDGKLQLLVRDPALIDCYDVVGGKYVVSGSKIVITPMGVTDVLWDNPEAVIDYSDLDKNTGRGSADYRKSDDATRQASRDVELKVEMDAFYRWAKKKAEAIRDSGEDIRLSADHFYKDNLSPKDPVKDLPQRYDEKHGYSYWPSWNDRREAMWNDTIEVYWKGGWGIHKKENV